MSETKHTAGPLHIEGGKDGTVSYIVDGAGRAIASAHNLCDGVDNAAREAERAANEVLFAAAPELLEALESCHQSLDYLWSMHPKTTGKSKHWADILLARTAIAKATNGK